MSPRTPPCGRAAIAVTLVLQLLLVPALASGFLIQPAGAASSVSESVPGARSHVSTGPNQVESPCVGTIRDRPDRTTLLSIQGARGSEKTVAMLVGIRPSGEVVGVHNGTANGRWWFYDVDRLENGNLLLSTTVPGGTIIEEIDPATGEHVSVREFPDVLDAHDVDLINGDQLLITDMSQDGDDRVLVYNLTREAVTWQYRFAEHPDEFPHDAGGEFGGDWTHNNDVEQIRPGVFMVSLKNFDQVVAIDRSTKEVVWRLGADDDYDVLNEQHNPDYLGGEPGRPTVLVADSINDRVVEYTRTDGTWDRTWVLRGGGLDEPRDADRLPNGNTLVSDRRGDRLLEVTPEGEVLWEFYAPWQPYDAERLGTGDESAGGPTAGEMDATGVHEMTGSAGVDESRAERCYSRLTGIESDRLIPENESTPTPSDSSGNQGDAGGTADGGTDAGSTADGGTADGGTTDGGADTPESKLGTPTPGVLSTGTLVVVLVVGGVVLVAALAGLFVVRLRQQN